MTLSYRASVRTRQTNSMTNSIRFKYHAGAIPFTAYHYTNSAFRNINTNTLVDSNNTRIIPASNFNIKPLNQIHYSLFGLTRELAIDLNR